MEKETKVFAENEINNSEENITRIEIDNVTTEELKKALDKPFISINGEVYVSKDKAIAMMKKYVEERFGTNIPPLEKGVVEDRGISKIGNYCHSTQSDEHEDCKNHPFQSCNGCEFWKPGYPHHLFNH